MIIYRQKGATLIVVLIVVLLVTIVAVVAMRQSTVSLNIATNSQIQKLMMQNSDAALFQFEQLYKQNNSTAVNSLFSTVKTQMGKEVVFCYVDSKASFFSPTSYGLIYWTPGDQKPTTVSANNFCNRTSYSSGRSTVVTQVSVEVSNTNDDVILSDSSNAGGIPPSKIKVFATSFMPSLSSASDDAINSCLVTNMSMIPTNIAVNNAQTVTDCLSSLNVPNYTAVADYQEIN